MMYSIPTRVVPVLARENSGDGHVTISSVVNADGVVSACTRLPRTVRLEVSTEG
jgi:hypothetical protein